MAAGVVRIYDFSLPDAGFLDEVLTGLSRVPKELPSKYFYDAEGSGLFEAICELPEYYLTRAELALMDSHGDDIGAFIGPAAELIELGSGSGRKTRRLIEAARPVLYVPIDISRDPLERSAAQLAQQFPWLNIGAIVGDFCAPLALPAWKGLDSRRRALYFPGSTIGNFERRRVPDFLLRMRGWVGDGGVAVIGVDLKKDAAVLNAAYNDAQGVTASFNLNLLRHINRVLGADFDVARFAHVAFYDEEQGRIEMHLRSLVEQEAVVAGRRFGFASGEMMRTEISCKYSVAEFQALARDAGFEPVRVWFDPQGLFSVHGLVAR